jgi:hypothetical protein
MSVDLRRLLRQMALASSPLLGSACNPPYWGNCDIKPDEPFEIQVAVLGDDSFVLMKPGTQLSPEPDGGPTSDGGPPRHFMPPEVRDHFAQCVAAHAMCGPFCKDAASVAFTRAVELQTCAVVGGSAERPILIVTGLGTSAVCGRRPVDVEFGANAGGTAAAAYLGACAALEAASVPAFRRLARELEEAGAPPALAAGADAAARDEVRHIRAMRALAARHGGALSSVRVPAAAPRSLSALAQDNAAEGCVRETFGALVAHLQACTAADPVVRAVMAQVAEDETRHAELAWAIEAWAFTRLDPRARWGALEARAAAVEALRSATIEGSPDPETSRLLGLPSASLASALIDELGGALWATS